MQTRFGHIQFNVQPANLPFYKRHYNDLTFEQKDKAW